MRKQKLRSLDPILFLGMGAVVSLMMWMMIKPKLAFTASLEAVGVWWQWLLPSLFPALFLSCCIYVLLASLLNFIPIQRKVLWLCACLLLGSPLNSILIKRMHARGYLTSRNSTLWITLVFTHNPLWLFVVLALASTKVHFSFVATVAVGYILSALFLTCILFRRANIHSVKMHGLELESRQSISIGEMLGFATRLAGTTVLSYGGLLLLGAVATAMLADVLQDIYTNDWRHLLFFVFEQNHILLLLLEGARKSNETMAACLFATALAWGGMSAHVQMKLNLIGVYFHYATFIRWRLIQMALAAMFCALFIELQETFALIHVR